MKFVDVVNLKITGGNGGDGVVAFHRELYVPKGGPSGGDGGNGADVFLVADSGMNTLVDFRFTKEIIGEAGVNGGTKKCHGRNGEIKVVKVPVGTIVYDGDTNKILHDVKELDKKYLIARGGKGGRGNARFVNSRNKAPTIFERGDLGESLKIRLELKVIADVGFIGKPNAGKSTLLSVISNSRPTIADYPFTTINPQLGVCKINDDSFVVADLPGLIEQASKGKGLGLQFLRHIERCRIIVHVLDMSGNYNTEDVYQNYLNIKQELIAYNPKLGLREEIIVANKMDIENSADNLLKFKNKLNNSQITVLETSGLKKQNIDALKQLIANKLKNIPDKLALWELNNNLEPAISNAENSNFKHIKFENHKPDFKIEKINSTTWKVSGEDIFKIYHKNPIATHDNLLLFNSKLQKIGLFEELTKRGAEEGDTIKIFELELQWNYESKNNR
ncbi:GTPase ObgE [Spiroplasma endosymbiont of Amphibalanus improvisus]|uniref:GTPase ObgE n=1 Tax=Spiroplasma endosymbiont of Amphibalanus improvisus TaxID=3066327 RepID=UPI00313C46B3